MELKPICNRLLWLSELPSNTFLAMRLTTLFLLAGFLHVTARGYTQEKVTLSEKNASLEKVFTKIRQQTGYSIWYDESLLGQTSKIDVELKDATLAEALDACCRNQSLTYSIVGKMVVIKKREEKKDPGTPPAEIKGRVINEKGEPLAGATITVKGTAHSIQTDGNGEFSLQNTSERPTLIISNVGYEAQTQKAISNKPLLIVLKQVVGQLDQVLIIPYGESTKRLLTGSISKVTSEEIEKQPVSNTLEALEGRVPGLFIQQTTGVPGGGFNLTLRGRNSIGSGNDPLYIVDGVPFTSTSLSSAYNGGTIINSGSPLNAINPSDIESIEILKDADATAIYGSRGANGVILITTKKGKPGAMKADIDVYAGSGKVTRIMKMLNTRQYLDMRYEAFKNDGETPQPYDNDLSKWDTTRYTNWQKFLIGGTAHVTSSQVSLSGGDAHTQFLIGGGYYKQSTVFPGDFSDQRGSVHLNLTHASLDKKFNIKFSSNYLSDNNNLLRQDLTSYTIVLPPDAPPVFDSNGNLNFQNGSFYNNPFSELLRKYHGNTANLITNTVISYQPVNNLKISVSAGYNTIEMKEISTVPIKSFNNPTGLATGSAAFSNNSIRTWIIEPQAEYQVHIGKGKITALVGTTFQENILDLQTLSAEGYTSDALLENIQAAPSINISVSNYVQYRYNAVFGRLGYNYKDKYLVNVTGRRDGSSRFGPGKQFADFGAIGAAWIFSKENAIQHNLSFLSLGKIRASYGTTGNDQIADYGYLDSYSSTTYPYQGISGLIPTRLANSNYAWEINKKFEVAWELGVLDNRVLVSLGNYRNRSSNQLVGYSLPVITGQATIQYNLPATVQNTGWEFELTTINVKRNFFSWTTGFNLTLPRNKLLAYPGLAASSYANSYVIGQPLFIVQAYHSTGVDPATGIYTFEDVDKDGTISYPNDLKSLKKIEQAFYGGLSNSLAYKGWQLDIFVQFVKQTGRNYLASVYNKPGSRFSNQPTIVLSRWQKPGDITSIQQFSQNYGPADDAYTNASNNADNSISDASFIRLKNVSLSYTLPAQFIQKLHLQHFRIYVESQNLLTLTNYLGADPENQNMQVLPPLKMIVGGFKLTF